jgi:ER lumen protein retaining receptor
MKLLLNQNKKINKKILFFIIKISFFFSIFSFNFWWFDLIYSFSLWLESFSILAEIFLLENEKKDEFIFFYLFVIFFYRIFYFFNWIFNYFYQAKFYLIKFLTIGNQIIIIFIFFIKNVYKNKIKKIK